MTEILLSETFTGPDLSPRLQWLHPPSTWQIADGALVIHPDAQTDYWQRTHYGFRADNGHLLYAELSVDFMLTTTVAFEFVHQFDQAGLMVRLSPDCWLKTSVEYEPQGPNRLGAVVTNHGYSDWSTQDFSDDVAEVSLRVRREGQTYTVEYALDCSPSEETYWSQIRLARLDEDDGQSPILCGLYACSPKGAGLAASFQYITIRHP